MFIRINNDQLINTRYILSAHREWNASEQANEVVLTLLDGQRIHCRLSGAVWEALARSGRIMDPSGKQAAPGE